MLAQIERNLESVKRLCERFRVRRLDVFGSAMGERFDAERSDLDFLVEFSPMMPGEHADVFFGLQEALEDLFDRPVDLLERTPIRNPYLLESIDRTKVVLYAAA